MLFSMPDFEIERDSNWCENHRVKCEREKETAFCLFFVFTSFFSLDSTYLWSCSEINSRNEVSNFAMAPI